MKTKFLICARIPLNVSTFISKEFNILNNNSNYTPEFFEADFYKKHSSMFLIDTDSNDEIVAACLLSNVLDRSGPWLSFFIVDSRFRNNLLGTQLITKIQKLCPVISLECEKRNIAAINFYKKNRFKTFDNYTSNDLEYLMWDKDS